MCMCMHACKCVGVWVVAKWSSVNLSDQCIMCVSQVQVKCVSVIGVIGVYL